MSRARSLAVSTMMVISLLGAACDPARSDLDAGQDAGPDTGRGPDPDSGLACSPADPSCGPGGYAHFRLPAPGASRMRPEGELVRDEVTGLLWQRQTSGVPVTLLEAEAECAALVLGGREDFRLPRRIELSSLLELSAAPPIAEGFLEVREDYHWSASRSALAPERAFSVYFGQGETVTADATRPGGHVRCVAGEVPAIEVPLVDLGEVVLDRATELEWAQALTEALPQAEAEVACASLRASGRGGFRLPSALELASIVDESQVDPALDASLFTEAPAEPLWSSESRDLGERVIWIVDFFDGHSDLLEATASLRARCVRRAL